MGPQKKVNSCQVIKKKGKKRPYTVKIKGFHEVL